MKPALGRQFYSSGGGGGGNAPIERRGGGGGGRSSANLPLSCTFSSCSSFFSISNSFTFCFNFCTSLFRIPIFCVLTSAHVVALSIAWNERLKRYKYGQMPSWNMCVRGSNAQESTTRYYYSKRETRSNTEQHYTSSCSLRSSPVD